jgi:hypothetical protein
VPDSQVAPEAPAQPTPTGLDPSGERKKDKPPQTVQELAGRTIQSSKEGMKKASDTVASGAEKAGEAVTGTIKSAGEQIGKAGTAVGNAAKKTWNCLTSLFQSC